MDTDIFLNRAGMLGIWDCVYWNYSQEDTKNLNVQAAPRTTVDRHH